MSNAFNEAWSVLKGTPYSNNKGAKTQFSRGTYPYRAGSANYMRDTSTGSGRNTLPPESEAGWTRMQNPTIRSLLQRFARRGAQNIAAANLPWSQRAGATLPDESSNARTHSSGDFVIGGPSHDEGNFPLLPEISPVKQGQVIQSDPSASVENFDKVNRLFRGRPELSDEKLERIYGDRLRDNQNPWQGLGVN